MLKMLHRLIGEDIELVATLGAGGFVKADPNQLEQVIMNLVVNARDAMPLGGYLQIETADVDVDAAISQQHEGLSPGKYVIVTLQDTGCGIDESTIPHIFEPFFTTKGLGEGTGLGLSMVHGIVAQSGGCVRVESVLGRGTLFQIYLPFYKDVIEAPLEVSVSVPRGGHETILIAEDEEIVRGIIRQMLEGWGYKVLVAKDGQAACALFDGYEGQIDLLLTDVVMPGMSGQVLAERLTTQQPYLKVLYMSGYTHDFIGRHGELGQDVAFVQKPIARESLMEKIREVLDD